MNQNTMIRIKILTFLLFLSSTGLQAQQLPNATLHEHTARCSHAHFPINYSATGIGDSYDMRYQRLEWTVDPAKFYISGIITTYFVPMHSKVSTLSFDLTKSLIVDSVIIHQQNQTFTHKDNVLSITLDKVLQPNQLDSVQIVYHGEPFKSGFGTFTKSTHKGIPIIWTLSEPYGAKDWWPCKQDLTDKVDSIDILITAPKQYKAASNGVLLSEIENGEQKTTHWAHKHAIAAYLIAFAVTEYEVYTEYAQVSETQKVPIINYVYPERAKKTRKQTKNLIPIMELYSRLFMPYPFADEKYGHAQFGWGGGMEHQTMSFMGSFSISLMAHELAHQWFGDYITCGSWQDIWLNEGFAVYLEGLAIEHGYNPYNNWSTWKKGQIRSVTSKNGGSLFVNDTSSVWGIFNSRLTYNKGSMVLHMIRWELGDSLFFKALQNYLADPKLAHKYAYTKDLRQHFEAVSNRNLKGFFDNWVYQEGFPIYTINYEQNNDNILHLSIQQTQSHPSVNCFQMHLPIQVKGNGQDSLLRIENNKNMQEYFIPLDFEINEFVFDPESWIVTRNSKIIQKENTLDEKWMQLKSNVVQETLKVSFNKKFVVKKIEIINRNGTIIASIEEPKKQKLEIIIKHYESGTYIIKAESAKGVLYKQFIKQ